LLALQNTWKVLEGEEESTIMKTKQQEQQMKHGSHSLKSLITHDHLSQIGKLGEIGSFELCLGMDC
jgi:hypothetical protein